MGIFTEVDGYGHVSSAMDCLLDAFRKSGIRGDAELSISYDGKTWDLDLGNECLHCSIAEAGGVVYCYQHETLENAVNAAYKMIKDLQEISEV